MKKLILPIVSLVFTLSSFSQMEPGIASLNFGDIAHFDDVSIEFIELISDSRCPKNVNCIRAGEAEVLVAIYKNGNFSHNKKLVFHASGIVNQNHMQLFSSDYLNVQGLALYPYPVSVGKIVDENYYLDLQISN